MLRILEPVRRLSLVQGARRSAVAGTIALLFATGAGAQQGAHEHGVANLHIAIDGSTLLIEFDSPLDNLVGFEHEPRSDEQRVAVASVETGLRDFTTYFELPAAAGCVLADVQVESPYPQPVDDHDHKHDDHAHGNVHGHADIYVVYEFECAQAAALDQIGLNLTSAFPRITIIRAKIATPNGQRAVRLDKSARSLAL